MTDREKFLAKAREYIGKNGYYVCIQKVGWGCIVDWCALAVSAIMLDCGYIGKYIKEVEGGAGSIPRKSVPAKCGEWFKKGTKKPQPADLFFTRKADFPGEDEYFSSHVGIVESVDGDKITTLEGNVDGYSYDWAGTSTFKRKTRYLSDWNMYAFYRPFWKDEQKTTTTSAKKDVEIYQLNSSKKVDYTVKVVASDGLNIRQGAGLSYKILGTVPCNSFVKVTNYTSGGAYKWGLVEYDGIKGWIALDYTEKIDIDAYAQDVIKGKYGNGQERKNRLGILYDEVQKRVNQILSKKII